MITKKINKILFTKKLNAMYDYLIELEINLSNVITLSDRHGIEQFTCEKSVNTRDNLKPEIIYHRIDRRELVRKLKAMTEAIILITFDNISHKITLQGITTKETSVYYCISDDATTKEQTFGLFNWFR